MSSSWSPASPPRVLLVCSGLDHALRGYESFARECFEQLHGCSELQLDLAKGSGGPSLGEHVSWTLRRDRRVALTLGRLGGFRPFRLEALAFGLGLQPLLWRWRPDVVYLSEWDTARALWMVRSALRQSFKLVLVNGGFASRGFEHLARVQELTPAARDRVIACGADPTRHTVLPLGFSIDSRLTIISTDDKAALRHRLGLPEEAPIVLSVAALDKSEKRLDYLVTELARLPTPRPYLLMAGERGSETPAIERLVTARLGRQGFTLRTVPAAEVKALYQASDIFVLTSLAETQGRALIEAASHGLPCLAHDSPIMRYAVGPSGSFADFAEAGSLTRLLTAELSRSREGLAERARASHRHVFERFSWERLRPRYVELLREAAFAKSTVSSSTGENVPR